MKPNVKAYLEFRYEKVRLIKQSGKGEVWLAINKATNEPVIMKIINSGGLPYLTLKKNPHPLFAKIFYCAESETDTVVVEEFIIGETMSERENLLTEVEARKILLQMCDGLKFLHGLGIIHRDIKPSNLILQSGGNIRLIDFDAARTVKDNQSVDTNLLGTKGYAPPEQYGFGQTDSRSDIYSLGKTMLELTGDNCGSLKKILAKCVEVDPKNRYQSADELSAALNKKIFPTKKFCAILIIILAILLIHNSTNEPEFTAETEKIPAPEIKSETVESTPEPEYVPEIIEPTPEPEYVPETIEPTPEPKTETESETTIEDFQPSFPTNEEVTLENFKPSFPKKSTFLESLPAQ